MANRQFTKAGNGNLYCNLNTTFRVGANAILVAYADLKQNSKPTNKVSDPYAPIEAVASTKKPKINTRKIFLWIEEKLKNHGYTYFDAVNVDSSAFDTADVVQLKEWFADLSEEFDATLAVDMGQSLATA